MKKKNVLFANSLGAGNRLNLMDGLLIKLLVHLSGWVLDLERLTHCGLVTGNNTRTSNSPTKIYVIFFYNHV